MRRAGRRLRTLAAVVATLLSFVLAGAALAAPATTPATAASPTPLRDIFPGVANAYLVTVDDVPLFGAATTRRLPPASLAKLVAALVVIDAVDGNVPVTIGPRAAAATGSRAGLRAGERLRSRDLLAAMLIASANDACLALAEHVSGSERAFVARMNERAKVLGLAATRFENACGFDAPRMMTTADDLVVVAQAALAQPAIAAWTAVESHSIRTIGGRDIVVRNTNAFVGRIPGVTGLKTGYTSKAGRNLILTAVRDGHRATVVLLGAQDRWWDAAALLERAFDTTPSRAMTYARAYALLVVATFAAYATSLGGAFQFDDYRVIVDNPAVHGFSAWWASMPGMRPLLKASYALSWRTGGGDALVFHLFNLACHVASACLVLALVRRWTDGTLVMPAAGPQRFAVAPALPLAVALLFALHPAQTEAVTYVSGRSSSLMAMLYLASLLCWDASRGRHAAQGDLPGRESGVQSHGFLLASLALFVAALGVKEAAWTLPFAIFLIEVTRNGARWRAALRAAGPHLALLAAGAVAILALPGYRRMLAAALTLRDPLANLAAQVSGVAYLVVHPLLMLDVDIDPVVTPLAGVAWWIAAIVLLGLLWIGIRGAWRGFVPGFGVAWFFLHLAPTNSLIARDDLANDRQLVLALLGFCVAFCSLTWVRLPRRAFAPMIAALAIVFGTVTAVRNLDYRSEVALWQSSLTSNPRNARAWNNLGMAWRAVGDLPQARVAFERALEIDPLHPQAMGNLLELDRPR